VKNENAILRAAHAQAAVVRTLAAEMQRQQTGGAETESLRAQALEESARLIAAVERLAGSRRDTLPPGAGGQPSIERSNADGRRWPRVLVVEDDYDTRAAIARGLAPEYEVVVAANGIEGLKAASETKFDAIVADIAMPQMDGITMVAEVRRKSAPAVVPVVFLTAETMPERVVDSFSAGATSYLVKPIDLDVLDGELRHALRATQ
jgi:CheY-like chemotaxis protein